MLEPYFEAMGWQVVAGDDAVRLERLPGGGAKLHATGEGQVVMSEYKDFGARIATFERLLDRLYGRATQQTEISGPGGGPVDLNTAGEWDMDRALAWRARDAASVG
jgi:hypothetical protein